MITRDIIIDLASKQGVGCGRPVSLSDEECAEIERIIGENPRVTNEGLSRMFLLLRRRLAWQDVDRGSIPPELLDFFDAKVSRDMDMLSLAHTIGHDIRSACEGCTCRC